MRLSLQHLRAKTVRPWCLPGSGEGHVLSSGWWTDCAKELFKGLDVGRMGCCPQAFLAVGGK